jgi:hypothetical protein
MGEALAKKSTGTSYVLMLKGQPINNFWKDNEYPSLKDRVKVIAINAVRKRSREQQSIRRYGPKLYNET